MQEIIGDIILWALGLAGTVFTSVAIPYATKWLQAKTDNETLDYVIGELGQTVSTSVDFVNQTFVNQLRLDGTFDKEKQAEAMSIALDHVIVNLSTKTKQILSKDGIDLEGLITQYIEAKIAEKK